MKVLRKKPWRVWEKRKAKDKVRERVRVRKKRIKPTGRLNEKLKMKNEKDCWGGILKIT